MSEVSQDLLMLVKPELPESFSALLKVLRLHEEEEGTHFTFTKCTAYVCKVLSISLSKQTSVTPCKAKFHILLITSFLVGVPKSERKKAGESGLDSGLPGPAWRRLLGRWLLPQKCIWKPQGKGTANQFRLDPEIFKGSTTEDQLKSALSSYE